MKALVTLINELPGTLMTKISFLVTSAVVVETENFEAIPDFAEVGKVELPDEDEPEYENDVYQGEMMTEGQHQPQQDLFNDYTVDARHDDDDPLNGNDYDEDYRHDEDDNEDDDDDISSESDDSCYSKKRSSSSAKKTATAKVKRGPRGPYKKWKGRKSI